MGSICSLKRATSVLASGQTDSSSSTSVWQKVQRNVPVGTESSQVTHKILPVKGTWMYATVSPYCVFYAYCLSWFNFEICSMCSISSTCLRIRRMEKKHTNVKPSTSHFFSFSLDKRNIINNSFMFYHYLLYFSQKLLSTWAITQ